MKYLINYVRYSIIAVVLIVVVAIATTVSDVSVNTETNDYPVIIIDAGHGGVDGGAVADDGTVEKELNLDIALKLNELLISKGYKTILTRDGDYSIHDESADTVRKKKVSDLHNRLEIVNSNKNAILVSVHQNYFTESKYSGTQVFYSPNALESSVLADCIQKKVVSQLQPDNTRQIKQSDSSIFLLFNSQIPSVMVECGFLSNQNETNKLKDEKYRQQMAEAVCDGIIKYLCSREESLSAA